MYKIQKSKNITSLIKAIFLVYILITICKPDTVFARSNNPLFINNESQNNWDMFNSQLNSYYYDSLDQNYDWGVLSINTNKESYEVGDDMEIYMSVLDNYGYTICNSEITLYIKNLSNNQEYELSTIDNSIWQNKACYSYTSVNEDSDYESIFKLDSKGVYQLHLTATNKNGTHTITKYINVGDINDFDIERQSATRIYPLNIYPMLIKIESNIDYKGLVEESVPSDYEIMPSSSFEIKKENGRQKLIWEVDFKKGNTYTLKYLYDAPDRSPDLKILGPLNIDNHVIQSSWNIAVDTTYDDVILATNGGPTYRLQFENDLTEEVSAITVSGNPNSYVTTIIDQDTGYSAEYSGAQETVLTNQTDVNSATTYRKSVSFWVDIHTFGTGTGANSRIIWEEGGSTNWWSAYTSNGDELWISIGESGNSVGSCSVSDLSTDNIYFVVMQWEASSETMELWIDGVLGCSTTTSTGGGLSSHTGDWQIGGSSDALDHTSTSIGGLFDGVIDDYSYWAEPTDLLSQSEIEAIFDAGSNLPPSPTLNNVPFPNEKTGDSTPDFEFKGVDPDGSADMIYQIMIDDNYDFSSPLINCESDTTCTNGNGTFVNTQNGSDTNPFTEDQIVRFTPTTTMSNNTTYYWRVRVEGDVLSGGGGVYGNWSSRRSLTYVSGTDPSSWYQTTDEQFDTDIHVKTITTGSDSVEVDSGTFPYIVTQSNTMDFSSGVSSQTYDLTTAVRDLSKAFILVWGTGPDQDIERVKFKAKFNSEEQIEISRGESGTTAKASWQVIEASDYATTPAFTVQTDEISIASGSTTGSDTITDVGDTDQVTVIVQPSCGSSDNTTQVQFRGYLSSTTQVDVARYASGSACTVRYWVVKWASSINVYTGTTTTANASDTASIGGTVDRSRSVLFMSWSNDTNGLAQHTQRGYLSSTTQITFSRGASTGSNTVAWSVVEFPSGVSVQADNGSSSPTLGTTGTTADVTLSTISLANSMVIHSQQVTGTGSAIVRGETIAYMTSTTNLRFEKLYTGQTSTWSYFVTDFSGWTFTATTGGLTTTSIDFDWLSGASDWNQLIFNDSEATGDLKYDILYWDGDSWEATGITNQDTSPVDISSLDPVTHNLIRVWAQFTDISGSPELFDLEITWSSSSNTAPSLSSISVNGGTNISLTEGSTVTVNWTSVVTDIDEYTDISSVNGVLYRSGVSGAQSCTSSNSNCYIDSDCTLSGCSGNTCNVTCSVSLEFFAQPTDASSIYSTEYWRGWMEVTDSALNTDEEWSTSGLPDVETMAAMDVTSPITYDPLLPGDDTGDENEITTITNTGNTLLDIELSGDNFCTDYPTCSGSQIAVGYQEYDTSNFTYGIGTALSSSPNTVEIDLAIATTRPSNSYTQIYWGMGVPNPKEEGSYSGANTILAIDGA